MSDYADVIFWGLVGGLFSILGGVLLIANKTIAAKIGTLLSPFAAGALIGTAFFNLLPEAVELGDPGDALRWAAFGILIFFLLEHYLHWFHHHHEHKGQKKFKKPTAPLIIIGDTVHNVIDGVAIGAAFVINPAAGIATAIAVAAHEIPQEIGDFSILLRSGMRRLQVLGWNAVSSLATVIAAIYTFYLGSNEGLPMSTVLGLAAGLFIYVAASDLIPTIHEEAKGRASRYAVLLFVVGLFTVGAVSEIAHEQIREATKNQTESTQESDHK